MELEVLRDLLIDISPRKLFTRQWVDFDRGRFGCDLLWVSNALAASENDADEAGDADDEDEYEAVDADDAEWIGTGIAIAIISSICGSLSLGKISLKLDSCAFESSWW